MLLFRDVLNRKINKIRVGEVGKKIEKITNGGGGRLFGKARESTKFTNMDLICNIYFKIRS